MANNITQTDYRKAMWDRMEEIAYPGEHTNLFGHDEALQTLCRAYNSQRLHHAWLVTGPKGIGKASFALAIAGHMLRNPVPADAPPGWVRPESDDNIASMIGKGGHPNLLHLSRPLDPKTKKFKSELTIDEIRRTIGFFGTTAGENSWRICIVDTADEMNEKAANALLKILEEPPQRTIFFVLSSSPGKLLPTIRSRCRQLALRPLNNENLQLAIAALGVDTGELDGSDLAVLYQLSSGSVRRAITLLRQDGLKVYRRFGEILGSSNSNNSGVSDSFGNPDWLQAHQLADELVRKNKEDQYRLLFDIAEDYISGQVRREASKTRIDHENSAAEIKAAQSTLSNLARMCEVWEKTASSVNLADSYNLDKKQVILNLFGSLAQFR